MTKYPSKVNIYYQTLSFSDTHEKREKKNRQTALGLFAERFYGDFLFVAHLYFVQRLLCSILLTLAFGESAACAEEFVAHIDLACKELPAGVVPLLDEAELHGNMAFLRNLYQAALIVGVCADNLLNIHYFAEDATQQETLAHSVASVDVYCAHECLEGVAVYVAIMLTTGIVRHYKLVEAKLQGNSIQRLAAHKAAARLCEEALALFIVARIENIRDYRVDDGVAQKFESLVAHEVFLTRTLAVRAVRQRCLIEREVFRQKAEHLIQYTISLLILASEKET